MAKRRNAICRHCGKHRDKVGTISARGSCQTCATKRLERNLKSMTAKRGENYSRYIDGVRAYADQL